MRILGIVDNPTLLGQLILVVEEQPYAARDLQVALERAGAEVVVVPDAARALRSIEQRDFTAAVLDWRPNSSEQRTVARWLRKKARASCFAPRSARRTRRWHAGHQSSLGRHVPRILSEN